MPSKKELEKIKWREPNEEDKKRLSDIERKSRVGSILILGFVALFPAVASIYIKEIINLFKHSTAGAIVGTAIFLLFEGILISQVHLKTKMKVADVVVDKLVVNRATDIGNLVTANVSQGSAKVSCVNISSKNDPKVGEKVLLYMDEKDDWTVGIL
ncbi:MAG: hypothetical protein J6Y08_09385 [Clostridiales bacterium]|nr:hypothetical protein [Clostridiales bacterium]